MGQLAAMERKIKSGAEEQGTEKTEDPEGTHGEKERLSAKRMGN